MSKVNIVLAVLILLKHPDTSNWTIKIQKFTLTTNTERKSNMKIKNIVLTLR